VSLRALLMLAVAAPACALAQNEAIQRELLIRQQQSDAFSLQLRQSQERLQGRGGYDMDARHLSERQRLDAINAQQQWQAVQPLSQDPGVARQLMPYQLERAAQERLLALPPPLVQPRNAPPEEAVRPLPIPRIYE
jgi:hypothetical protein